MKHTLSLSLILLVLVLLGACSTPGLPADKPASQYGSPQELIFALEASGVLSCRAYEDSTPIGGAQSGITSGHCVAVLGDNSPVPLLVTVFAEFGVAAGGLDTYMKSYQDAARANNGDPILLVGPNWIASSTRETLIATQGIIGGSLRE